MHPNSYGFCYWEPWKCDKFIMSKILSTTEAIKTITTNEKQVNLSGTGWTDSSECRLLYSLFICWEWILFFQICCHNKKNTMTLTYTTHTIQLNFSSLFYLEYMRKYISLHLFDAIQWFFSVILLASFFHRQ